MHRVQHGALRAAAFVLGGALLASGAAAQTVYRCGPDARTYQAAPCADGRPVDVTDRPSAERRRAAREAAASNARLARRLESERRAREAAIVPARAGGIGPAPAAAVLTPAPRPYRHAHGQGHRGDRGARYFPDGTRVPPVYRVPAQQKAR